MPNKKVLFAGNKPTKHIGRNGFDGSAARVFTMRPAVIRPVFFQHTVPNSSYRIHANDIVRASALQTAAFLRGKHELDFYFIPYSMIQTNANDIILQRGDTPTLASQAPTSFRTLNLQYLIQWAAVPYIFQRWFEFSKSVDSYTRSTASQTINEAFLEPLLGSVPVQGVDYKWYNALFYEQIKSDDDVFNILNFNCVGSDCLTLLSSLGYGDYYLAIKTICDNVINAYGLSEDIADSRDLAGAMLTSVYEYILCLSNGSYDTTQMRSVADARSVNILPLMSYQKVWREFYRDTINDDSALSEYACTGDLPIIQYPFTGFVTSFHESDCPLMTFLRPRRRMYKRDLATGLYASAQFGEVGDVSLEGITIKSDATLNGSSSRDVVVSSLGNISVNSSVSPDDLSIRSSFSVNNAFSAYDVKYAFAMQKFRETLLRAGNRTKDVLMAEFGVRSEYVEHNMPKYLGSFSGSLDLNKVAATSDAGDYSVGDLGGNVFSSLQGDTINFTCNDFGIVIGFMSFVTDPLHNAFGVDAMNIKSEGMDFYHEEFANLGLQPVSSERFSLLVPNSMDNASATPVTLGFAARDIEYKQNTDFVFDNFCTSPIFPKHLVEYLHQAYNIVLKQEDGSNTNYVSVKNLYQSLSLAKDRTYLLPNCMDSIFKSLDNGSIEHAHFDVCLQITMSEVLPMPVTGLM